NRLKTQPFYDYLKDNFPSSLEDPRDDLTIYYGFDKDEVKRIQRRAGVMGAMGYKTDYPLALWEDADHTIVQDADIAPPLTYQNLQGLSVKSLTTTGKGAWKHANCVGCLKAGKQHW
ncbi:hypothetical protein AB4356_25755, partial [Vibrio lentus]